MVRCAFAFGHPHRANYDWPFLRNLKRLNGPVRLFPAVVTLQYFVAP
jgi:hypothetical protein